MAADPKPKETTQASDQEWISRAVAAMPDPAVTPRPAAAQPQGQPAAVLAANDDRRSIGELLRSLQLRPGYSGFAVASALSGTWVALGALFAWLYLPGLGGLLQSPAAVPVLIGLGALALVPVSFFFMLAHMRWRAKELRLVTESMASLALRLAEPQATAQETISQLGDQMRREINIMTTGVERAMERASELEARVNGQVAALERAHREAEDHARALTDRLAEQYALVTSQADHVRGAVEAARSYSEKAAAMMQALVADTDARVDTQVRVLGQSIESALTRFQQAIENRSRAVDDGLASRAHDMMKSVNESGKDLAAAIDRRIKDASAILDARTAEIEEAIGGKIEHLDKTLQHRLVTIAQSLDARIANFEDMASGRAHETAIQIEVQTKATSDLLDDHLHRLTQGLRTSASEASGLIEQRAKAASEALVARTQQIAQAIEARTTEARQSLGQLANDIEHKIVELCSNAGAALAEDAVTVEGKLSGLSASITAALTRNAEYVERTLLNASTDAARTIVGQAEQVSSAMSEKTSALTSALSAHTAALTALLDTGSNSLLQALEQRIGDFTGEVTRANAHAVGLLEKQGSAFTRAIAENGAKVTAEINAASQAAVEGMRDHAREAESGIRAAIERGREATATSLAEMREVHSVLRSEGISMFERLREANVLLREALSGSQDNMTALEAALGERLQSLEHAVETFSIKGGGITAELASHIGSFQDSGARVADDLTRLVAQFESHGHSLVQTVDLIDGINRRTLDAVGERAAALESLVATLDGRALDFEQRLARFSALLTEALDSATARTRDIGLLVAESSSAGVRAIGEQYELVRATIGQESARSAEMLRNVYQTTVGEAEANLQQAAERFTGLLRGVYQTTVGEAQDNLQQASAQFAELVQGIKHMAAEMQRELEATRNELRSGVLDIPREAADNMTQMRQIIADQVEALTELHRLAARYIANTPLPRRDADEPAPSLPKAGPGGTDAKPGWLTELLERAGREPLPPERRTADQTIQSLDALSGDIARMLDSRAVSEVWDRYNRGERNVFTRKLYTPHGQRAFDEIRARYKSDRDFKHTADRYMNEFERLIAETSRDEQGQARARTYLTSETGKVYTMLAHASGRLD
ncbi:MAG TPA: hypothetical protein VHA55_13200 [Pseudorhodoplanes sp.]|nr:hypothetical protein [Pseudorhodoplanes sp.]